MVTNYNSIKGGIFMINLVEFLRCTASSEKIEAHFAGHCEESFDDLRTHDFGVPEHTIGVLSFFSMYDKDTKESYLDVTLKYLGEDKNYA